MRKKLVHSLAIVIFSSQIQAGKEFKLGNFFPVWILSRSEFDYWQQLFDAQGFHQSTENTFHPILSSSVSKALKKWLEGRWFKPTLFQNFYEKLVKFLMVCLHGWWGKAWALKRFSSLPLTGNCDYPERETALASLKKESLVVAIKGKIAFNRISFIRNRLYHLFWTVIFHNFWHLISKWHFPQHVLIISSNPSFTLFQNP